MFVCFVLLRGDPMEPLLARLQKQKRAQTTAATDTGAAPFGKPTSNRQSGGGLAAQFKQRNTQPIPPNELVKERSSTQRYNNKPDRRDSHPVFEQNTWKSAAQQKKLDRHRQQPDDQFTPRSKTTTSTSPPPPQQQQQQQKIPLLQRYANRTRDDFIFGKLLQRCRGRSRGGSQNGQQQRRDQAKCPQGNQWHQSELWKAWCLQSGACIPKAVCHKLIKRIGESSLSYNVVLLISTIHSTIYMNLSHSHPIHSLVSLLSH